MVILDGGEGLDVPGGGEFEGAVDLIETGDQILIQRTGTTSHQRVGDVTEVVADVAGALGLATGIRGEVGPLLLGGVGILVLHGLGGTIDQLIRLGGEGFGGFESILGTLEAFAALAAFSKEIQAKLRQVQTPEAILQIASEHGYEISLQQLSYYAARLNGDHWVWVQKGDAWRERFFARELQLDLQAA